MSYVHVQYVNGSDDKTPVRNFMAAMDHVHNKISYSGGKIKRVEIHDPNGNRAMYDASWNNPWLKRKR
jgi:hypothetical protein